MTGPINLSDPCPCRSGRTFEECCLAHCRVEEDPSTLVRLHFKLNEPEGFAARLLEHPFFTASGEGSPGLFKWVEMVAAEGPGSLGITWRTGKVLGVLWVGRDRATLECLGRLRAEKGRSVLTNVFGGALTFLASTYQDPENARIPGPLRPDAGTPRHGLTEGQPRSHYLENTWIHEPNQALGGLSPLACARKKKMRPKLAGLLVDLKNRGPGIYDFDRLARLLGVEKLVAKMGMKDKIDRLKHRLMILMDSLVRFIRVLEESDVDPALLDAKKLNYLVEMESSLKEAALTLEEGLPSKFNELSMFLNGMESMESSFFGLMHEIIDPIPQREEIIQRFNDPDFDHYALEPPNSQLDRELFDLAVDEAASHLEKKWRHQAEMKELSPRVSLSAALRKQPAQWVEAIYRNLGLSGDTTKPDRAKRIVTLMMDEEILRAVVNTLSAGGLDALRHAMKRGGVASYPAMARLFGTEENDGFYWVERPPRSVLGRLRSRGLAFAGRVRRGSRLYRSMVVPRDLREPLARLLLE